MPHFISEYVNSWKDELKREKKSFSPQLWGFVSFIAPLVAVPLAVKAATAIGKEVKKAIDKRK